jgi:hypothetical protein
MSGEIALRVKHIKGVLNEQNIAQAAFPTFYANTPVRTGNARRRTSVNRGEIQANYPYAQRLDNGWSKQRPDGMTKPTVKFIQDYLKRNLGK